MVTKVTEKIWCLAVICNNCVTSKVVYGLKFIVAHDSIFIARWFPFLLRFIQAVYYIDIELISE